MLGDDLRVITVNEEKKLINKIKFKLRNFGDRRKMTNQNWVVHMVLN